MTGGPRFLIVDGYTGAARAELAAGGASVAGDLYAAMIGQVQPGVADRIVDTIDMERILHHRVTDAVAAARAGEVAHQHDLRAVELHARRAGRDRGVEIEVLADLLRLRHVDLAQRQRDAEAAHRAARIEPRRLFERSDRGLVVEPEREDHPLVEILLGQGRARLDRVLLRSQVLEQLGRRRCL